MVQQARPLQFRVAVADLAQRHGGGPSELLGGRDGGRPSGEVSQQGGVLGPQMPPVRGDRLADRALVSAETQLIEHVAMGQPPG